MWHTEKKMTKKLKVDLNSEFSVAEKIWEDIKDEQLNMFALPDQTVAKYCTPIKIDPTRCFVTIKVSSVLPALEEALHTKFDVESAGKFVIITRK